MLITSSFKKSRSLSIIPLLLGCYSLHQYITRLYKKSFKQLIVIGSQLCCWLVLPVYFSCIYRWVCYSIIRLHYRTAGLSVTRTAGWFRISSNCTLVECIRPSVINLSNLPRYTTQRFIEFLLTKPI